MKTGLILVSVLLLLAGCGEEKDLGISAKNVEARVISVTDGDTIKVEFEGVEYDVRYLGMNTPEIAHGDSPGQECGQQATAANLTLVNGKTVRLERDVSDVDGYGRLLRYVYVDELMINQILVQSGWAEVVRYPPDTREFERFRELEQHAAAVNVGCHAFEIFNDDSYDR